MPFPAEAGDRLSEHPEVGFAPQTTHARRALDFVWLRLNAQEAEPGEVMLGFGPVAGELTLSATGDLQEAAANLFGCLHRLDAMGAERIAVAPVPDKGLGRAINDRLRRAAAPRG